MSTTPVLAAADVATHAATHANQAPAYRLTSTMRQKIHLAPRRMHWDFSGVPLAPAHDPVLAAFFVSLSYYLIAFEDFGIPVMRNELPKLADHPALAREAQAFVTQEALHSQGHARLNAHFEALGLDTAGLQREMQRFHADFARGTQQEKLAAVAAFEHVIFSVAEWYPGADGVRQAVHPAVDRLVLWHAMEETEHTAVVAEVYDHVYGTGAAAYGVRVRTLARTLRIGLRTLVAMWRAVLPQMAALCGRTEVPDIAWRPIVRESLHYTGDFLRFFHPRFTPWAKALPADCLPSLRRQMEPLAALGAEWRVVEVAAVTSVAEDVCAYELVAVGTQALPRWSAGAHVDVEIEPGIVRQYSLCGDPAETGRYRIAVKREVLGRGGSLRLHQEIVRGSRIRVGTPRNHFPLAADTVVETRLLAGGIGITPLLAMAHALHRQGAPFRLDLCARNAALAPFAGELAGLPFAAHTKLHLDSDAQASGAARVDLALLIPRWDAASPRALYICGPAPFIDAACALAAAAGWPDAAVHVERFAVPTAAVAENKPFTLHLAKSDQSFTVAADQTIVEAMEARGLKPATSCREGICGSCICGVTKGEVEHRDAILSDVEHKHAKRIAICVSRAKGDALTLDL